MKNLLRSLEGGDRRALRGTSEMVRHVLAEPRLFSIVFHGFTRFGPVIGMRCVDAVEKITAVTAVTAVTAEYLRPYKRQVLRVAARAPGSSADH